MPIKRGELLAARPRPNQQLALVVGHTRSISARAPSCDTAIGLETKLGRQASDSASPVVARRANSRDSFRPTTSALGKTVAHVDVLARCRQFRNKPPTPGPIEAEQSPASRAHFRSLRPRRHGSCIRAEQPRHCCGPNRRRGVASERSLRRGDGRQGAWAVFPFPAAGCADWSRRAA